MDIRKNLKILAFWFSRKSYIPLILVGGAFVALLYFDEDTSVTRNMEYDKQIKELSAAVRQENDSAIYYRKKREALTSGAAELEYIAREQYHMQRPTEDVFVITDDEGTKND